jgi:hypothetical protein
MYASDVWHRYRAAEQGSPKARKATGWKGNYHDERGGLQR